MARDRGKSGGGVEIRNPTSSSPKFRLQEFPSLKDTGHVKQRKKKSDPPFDTVDWYFKHAARKEDFPFDEVMNEAVKIKFTPIRLHWPSRQRSSSDEELEGKVDFKPNRGGHFWESRWFCPPPKVRIVPRILGPHPSQGTRIRHPGAGERKVTIVLALDHHPPIGDILGQIEPDGDGSPIPHSTSKILAKFIKHLWKGASLRSFVAVVCAEPAPVVRVGM